MTENLTSPPTKEYLGAVDVSARYGGSACLWRRLALSGAVPAYRVGAALIMFRREEVETYLLSRRITGPAACRDGRRNGRKPGRRPRQAVQA